jgi:hypothetical protein
MVPGTTAGGDDQGGGAAPPNHERRRAESGLGKKDVRGLRRSEGKGGRQRLGFSFSLSLLYDAVKKNQRPRITGGKIYRPVKSNFCGA